MSIVGPRSWLADHESAALMLRGDIKPGLTGLAELNDEGDRADPLVKKSRIERDLFYIDNRSILLDLKILIKTIAKLFK